MWCGRGGGEGGMWAGEEEEGEVRVAAELVGKGAGSLFLGVLHSSLWESGGKKPSANES